jgi:hypothetical protein
LLKEAVLPRLSRLLFSILALTPASCSVFFPGASGQDAVPATTIPTGCNSAPTAPLAPDGYYVNGNTVCTADGRAHLFHGVDRPSLEWAPSGEYLSAADFLLMASWKANAVRIALNQDFWLAASPFYNSSYASLVDRSVNWAESAGMDVILDLHWSDAGVLGSCLPSAGCQQVMADANSMTFWSEVAARYQNDGHVLFELYNEPHDVGWDIWRAGGATGHGWRAVGMQQLYDTVRATGANNLVVIGGLDYAYDLSGVSSNRINGYNILYATHPYNSGGRAPESFGSYWGYLTKTDPVIVTEFGDFGPSCSATYSGKVIAYADAHLASWTAWGWYPGGCSFPALINDWAGTPSASGTVVKAALAGYNDPADLTPDAGSPESDAGPPPESDAGPPPESDAGPPPGSDAGPPPESDAGVSENDAGTSDNDADSH